jgi:uncharacterized protein YabN with tetrapyrrole methylase and pyrophosphatase domain
MTALMRAQKVLSRAAKTKLFCEDYSDVEKVYEKLSDDILALKEAVITQKSVVIAGIVGNILFDLANFSRIVGVESELELNAKTADYIQEFSNKEEKNSQ